MLKTDGYRPTAHPAPRFGQISGRRCGRPRESYSTYSGTPGARSGELVSNGVVADWSSPPAAASLPRDANAAATRLLCSTSRLFAWQVRHQAAVKSTNTGRPSDSAELCRRRPTRPTHGYRRSVAGARRRQRRLLGGRDHHQRRGTRPPPVPTQPNTRAPRCAWPADTARHPESDQRASAHAKASTSICCASTHSSHTQVTNIRKCHQLSQVLHPRRPDAAGAAAATATESTPDTGSPCRAEHREHPTAQPVPAATRRR